MKYFLTQKIFELIKWGLTLARVKRHRRDYRKILYFSVILFLAGVLLLVLSVQLEKPPMAHGSSSHNVRGWLWSENIGWINTNCYNDWDSDGDFELYESFGSTSNLVSHWKMNNDWTDSAGSNNGTAHDGATFTSSGLFEQAGYFDGDGDYVSVTDATGLGLEGSAWTIEAWVKPTQLKNYGNAFEKFPSALTSGWGILTNSDGSWNFQRHAGGWADVIGGSSGSLANGVWAHIAVTYDGTNVRTYTDGSPLTTQGQSAITDNALDLNIGGDVEYDRHFNGLIDNAAIYDRAKSADEIASDYQAGACNYGLSYDDSSNYTLSGYAWSGNLGWVCFGGSCSGTAPDTYTPWACVGQRKTDGSCQADCGECFNIPGETTCTSRGTGDSVGICPSIATGSDSDLKAHWSMNALTGASSNEVFDLSGNGNTGTIQDNTKLAAGQFGQGLELDGSGDYVEVQNSSSINPSNITVELWVKSDTSNWNNSGFLVSKRDAYIMHPNGTSKNVNFYISDSGWYYAQFVASGDFDITQWHHYAGTYDGDTIKIYVDGVLEGETPHSGSISTSDPGNLYIGKDDGLERYFDGKIDNVAIYNREKTAEEIWYDAHQEISGWAQVMNMSDKGWLKLTGQESTNSGWWGAYIKGYDSGGDFYTIGGSSQFGSYAWQTEGNEEMSDNGLVGHWKMNGDWTDSSAYGNDGSGQDNATWSANGKFEQTSILDGDGDYVNIPDDDSLDITDTVTIEFWMYIENTPPNYAAHPIVKASDGSVNDVNFVCYLLGVGSSGNDRRVQFYAHAGGAWGSTSPRAAALNEDQWYHIAWTYDSSVGGRLYIDGSEISGGPVGSGVLTTNIRPVRLGAAWYGGHDDFDGLIDNVAIYNRVKDATEIENDYYKGQGYLAGTSSDKVIPAGWFKSGYSSSNSSGPITPTDFDSFWVTNYGCSGSEPNLYLQWSPAQWSEYYNYYRVQQDSASLCPDACKTGETGTGYTEYAVLSTGGDCSSSSCYYIDSEGTIAQNTGYCYCMRAFNETGNKWATDNPPTYPVPYWKKTPLCAPNTTAIDGTTCGQNKLYWAPVDATAYGAADGYNIYRALTSDGCDTVNGVTRTPVVSSTCELSAHAGEALDTETDLDGTQHLVGHWKMNESSWTGASGEVFDSSGKGNHGAAAGSANTTATDAKFNRSATFNHTTSDYVSIPDSDNLDFGTGAFTVELWVKIPLDGSLGWSGLVDKRYSTSALPYGWGIIRRSTDINRIAYQDTIDDGGSWNMTWYSATLADGWHHIAVVRDASNNYKFYVDGKRDTTYINGPAEVATLTNSETLKFGKGQGYLTGMIDNVAIYNTARTVQEILRDAEAFPLDTTPSGANNTCNITSNITITGYETGSLTCSGDAPCCRVVDTRIVPNIYYYYKTTALTEAGESPTSSISSGCTDSSDSNTYRHGCDKTICYPPSDIEEK